MKIVVNEKVREERRKEILDRILQTAKNYANRGEQKFTFYFEKGERGLFKNINAKVKEMSEGTVECGYRSDYGTSVIYYIVEKKE
jgi:hypothetical protein